MAEIEGNIPVGIDVHLVANQPHVVEEAVGEFTKTLWEAIAIVLVVSFLALGWRPGIVVAIAIPLGIIAAVKQGSIAEKEAALAELARLTEKLGRT